jgi:hypothetical protein
MLHAVGMTRRQARRMVRHESVITALIGAALGMPLGIFLAGLVTVALRDEGLAFSLPGSTLVLFALIAVTGGHPCRDSRRAAGVPAERPQGAPVRVMTPPRFYGRPTGRRSMQPRRCPRGSTLRRVAYAAVEESPGGSFATTCPTAGDARSRRLSLGCEHSFVFTAKGIAEEARMKWRVDAATTRPVRGSKERLWGLGRASKRGRRRSRRRRATRRVHARSLRAEKKAIWS